MTRKYLEAITKALNGVGPDTDTAYNAVHAIADAIAALMPGFDKPRFLTDCGFDPKK